MFKAIKKLKEQKECKLDHFELKLAERENSK
jgi:hypothetical protein